MRPLQSVLAGLFVALVIGLASTTSWAENFKPDKPANTDVVILAYYPPLMISENGDNPGISVDIIKEAANRLNRNLIFEMLPFRRALKTLQRRDDVIQPALYRNATRDPHYQWICKTHEVENVFLTLDQPINTLQEARQLKRIGVETDAAMDVRLTNEGFGNLDRVDRPTVNVDKLANGRIDAWALTRSLAQWVWRRAGKTQALIAGDPIESAEVYVVAGKGYPTHLAKAYKTVITEMVHDGTVALILNKYR